MKNKIKILLFFIFILSINNGYSLTLEEAINLAKKNLPYLKESEDKLNSIKFQYKSSLYNFFPTVNYSFTYSKYTDINPYNYFSRNHTLTLEWEIYSSGRNIFNYKYKKLNYKSYKDRYKQDILNTVYKVKVAYFKAAAKKKILNYREEQLKEASVDYNLALKKYKLGLVKKSDILNAKVRLENTKYKYIIAETDYKTSIAELNSLIGFPLDRETVINEEILVSYSSDKIPEFKSLEIYLLKNRPELKSIRNQIKAVKYKTKKELFNFTPSVSLFYSRIKSYSSLTGNDNYNAYGIKLNWLIFDGLGRYYRYLSSKKEELSFKENLRETERKLKLKLYKSYIKLKQYYKNLEVAKAVLEKAKLNYKQTLGEYKVGKNDIVALVKAESDLASAQEQLTEALLNIALVKLEIENIVGVEDFKSLCEN